jgi:hypothetical protein
VYDEDAKKIVVTFNGSSSPSTVTMNGDGITLDIEGKVIVGAGNVFVGSDSAT